MDYCLDRTLNIPLGIQLRGLIEYGITFGALQAGEKLPSVREMAEMVGVAPMTVAQVYRELKDAELIYSKPGSGNFISYAGRLPQHSQENVLRLHGMADQFIEHARMMGMSVTDMTTLIQTRINLHPRHVKHKLIMVGNFLSSTQDYAMLINQVLDDLVTVEATTVAILRENDISRDLAKNADMILTFAHRRREVMELLPGKQVVSISFIPSEETRRALASVNPLSHIVVVSIFPEFTLLMKAGVERFASHVQSITVINLDDPNLPELLTEADVLVYATGAESLSAQMAPEKICFEYRHIPDSGEIQRVIRPLLQHSMTPCHDTPNIGSYENQ